MNYFYNMYSESKKNEDNSKLDGNGVNIEVLKLKTENLELKQMVNRLLKVNE